MDDKSKMVGVLQLIDVEVEQTEDALIVFDNFEMLERRVRELFGVVDVDFKEVFSSLSKSALIYGIIEPYGNNLCLITNPFCEFFMNRKRIW